MNTLDVVILCIIGLLGALGFFIGLIRTLIPLVSVVISFVLAFQLNERVTPFLRHWVDTETKARVAAFFLIYFSVLIISVLVGFLGRKILKAAHLVWVDRLAGILFGSLAGFLLCGFGVIALAAFLQKGAPLLADSQLAPVFTTVFQKSAALIPEKQREKLMEGVQELEKIWEKQKERGVPPENPKQGKKDSRTSIFHHDNDEGCSGAYDRHTGTCPDFRDMHCAIMYSDLNPEAKFIGVSSS